MDVYFLPTATLSYVHLAGIGPYSDRPSGTGVVRAPTKCPFSMHNVLINS